MPKLGLRGGRSEHHINHTNHFFIPKTPPPRTMKVFVENHKVDVIFKIKFYTQEPVLLLRSPKLNTFDPGLVSFKGQTKICKLFVVYKICEEIQKRRNLKMSVLGFLAELFC